MYTPESELARLVRSYDRPMERRPGLRAPSLHASLQELGGWVTDARPYDKRQHSAPWASVVADTAAAIDRRGRRLRAATPALDQLLGVTALHELGASTTRRAECKDLLSASTTQLAAAEATVAAFDDLYEALADPSTAHEVVEGHVELLDAALRFSNRSLGGTGALLASALEDSAWAVDAIRAAVGDTEGGPGRGPHEHAGLTNAKRRALCRQYLMHERVPAHQVVWLCYERAHCRSPDWIVPIGGVTFMDGPTLKSVLDDIAAGQPLPDYVRERLPAELLTHNPLLFGWLDATKGNEGLREWAWARVDLGDESVAAPRSRARLLADSLVGLAAFHDEGTRWRPMTGGFLVADGVMRGGAFIYRQADETEYQQEWTSETLGEFAAELAPHFPAAAEELLDMLATARSVQANCHEDSNAAALLLDVQVIELLASKCSRGWARHMKSQLAATWARATALDELYDAHRAPTGEQDLRGIPQVEAIDRLIESVPGSYSARRPVRVRYDLALAGIPALVEALPDHAPGARRLRALDQHLRTPADAVRWIDDLIAQYKSAVDRLARCRNAAAHGGPVNRDVIATVRGFANGEAGRTASIGVWAIVHGETIADAHRRDSARDAGWRAALERSDTVASALVAGEPVLGDTR